MSRNPQIELKQHCLQLSQKMLDYAGATTREAGKASLHHNKPKEQYNLGKRDAYLHLYKLLKELRRETISSAKTEVGGRRRAIGE